MSATGAKRKFLCSCAKSLRPRPGDLHKPRAFGHYALALAAYGMMKASSNSRTHRATSILLVLTLHTLLILALARFMVSPQHSAFRMAPETRLFELIIHTARPPQPGTRKHAPAPTRAAVRPQTSLPAEPRLPAIPTPAPDIRGFGQALVGCAPENLATLDETQRSRCRKYGALSSYDPSAVDYTDHTDQVPGAKRWERELARKNTPLLLPCGNSHSADPVYTGACIIANIANGFTFQQQYENQPDYSDTSGK